MASSARLIERRLYRSLLRAAAPFGSNVVLTCLIDRTGMEDAAAAADDWEQQQRRLQRQRDGDSTTTIQQSLQQLLQEESRIPHSSSSSSLDVETQSRTLFRQLLREFVAGGDGGWRQMRFPVHVTEKDHLRRLIRREFRQSHSNDDDDDILSYTHDVRTKVAFLVLRTLNEKLHWYEELAAQQQQQQQQLPPVAKQQQQQAARGVTALPLQPASAYLRPGAFLIAHPNLTGYFRRTVVCLLDHRDDATTTTTQQQSQADSQPYGTYGLIINRLCSTGDRSLTLRETLQPLPDDLDLALGAYVVRDGGPVHVSLQMLHAVDPAREELKIGGYVVSMIPPPDGTSTAVETDAAIKYKGDIMNAAAAILSNRLPTDDVALFIGASSWLPGQLESEVERGVWLPCRGPPEIALRGTCQHAASADGFQPEPDLWLSMLSACGEDEARLAHLCWKDTGDHPYGAAADLFDDR